MSLCLSEISTELLIKIFTFVSIKDLYNLKRTCKRFNEIIKKWDHSIVKRITLVTNQKSENMLSRYVTNKPLLEFYKFLFTDQGSYQH